MLKTSPENFMDAFKKFYSEAEELRKIIEQSKRERSEIIARSIEQNAVHADKLNVMKYFEGTSLPEILELAKKLTSKPDTLVFLTTKSEKASFVLAASRNLDVNCAQIAKELGNLGVSGGGKNTIAQGVLPYTQAESVFAAILKILEEKKVA
jgi:alanyl-tRNA synthetase